MLFTFLCSVYQKTFQTVEFCYLYCCCISKFFIQTLYRENIQFCKNNMLLIKKTRGSKTDPDTLLTKKLLRI